MTTDFVHSVVDPKISSNTALLLLALMRNIRMHLLIFTSCVMEEKSIVAILSVKLHSLKYYLFMYVQCCNNIAYLPTYVDPKQIHNNFSLIQNSFWRTKAIYFYTEEIVSFPARYFPIKPHMKGRIYVYYILM